MNVAHDDYIQILVETGLVGLGLWMSLVIGSLVIGWKNGRNSASPQYPAAFAAVLAVSVYAVGNFTGTVDFNPDKKAAYNVTGSTDGFAVRPEVRYDYALDGRPFDGGRKTHQFTLGLDVIVPFSYSR